MIEVLDRFAPFENKFGMFPYSTPPGGVTQNDTLFTAYAVMAMIDAGAFLPQMKDRLFEAASTYITKEGATLRSPESNELDSNDNLVGWGILAHYLSPEFAQRILFYARKNGWVWPRTTESVQSAWLGRHRATEGHLMLATREERPDFILQGFWILALAYSLIPIFKGDQDAFSLSYCMARLAVEAPQTPIAMAIAAYLWKFAVAAGGKTMKKNLEAYGWGGSPHADYIR